MSTTKTTIQQVTQQETEERKKAIQLLLDETHAAMLNTRQEWGKHGETAALLVFVEVWRKTSIRLVSILETHFPQTIDRMLAQILRHQVTALALELDFVTEKAPPEIMASIQSLKTQLPKEIK